jgi:hypothetical protein
MALPFRSDPTAAGGAAKAIAPALGLFALWVAVTWLLEGRIETFLRPDAMRDRAVYALLANVAVGTVAATLLLSRLVGGGRVALDRTGFGQRAGSPLALLAALALGLGFYAVQGAPSWNPIVLINAYAQVLVVTVAEIVVCWSLVGSTVEEALKPRGRLMSLTGAAVAASVAFGIYHYAHSGPFNTHGMVLLLSVVGLATGTFFLATRDIYATVVFHNFLGVFGVVNALVAAGRVAAIEQLSLPLLAMAMGAVVVLGLCHRVLLFGEAGRG